MRELVEEERVREKVKTELEKVALMQEISWRQKSRATWLKIRGSQHRFFHCLANSHRRNNIISNLCIEGSVTSEQEVIKNTIIQYYKNLFIGSALWCSKLDGLEFPISRGGSSSFMDEDKAPSPDSFTISSSFFFFFFFLFVVYI